MSTNYYDKENNKLIKISGKGDFPADYGTKEEFETKKDSLPDGTVFTTTDEFVDAHAENYSTDEVVIGKWVDGKKIYRKVYPFFNQNCTPNGPKTVTTEINTSTVKNLIKVELVAGNTGGSSWANNAWATVYWDVSLRIGGRNDFTTSSNAYVVVEYTKVIDD